MSLRPHTKSHIAVVGSSDLEFSLPVPHMPSPGESIFAGSVESRPGGRASDICCALSKLGCRVFLFSCLGIDSYGAQILNGLRNWRVNVDYIERIDHPTGMTHTISDGQGNRIRVMCPGAGLRMSKSSLHAGKAMISSCQLMILLADISEEAFLFSVEMARHFRVPVLAVPSPAHRFKPEWTSMADILIANQADSKTLTKIYPAAFQEAEDVLNHFLKRGAGASVLYLGARGAAAASELKNMHFIPSPHFPGPPAPESEDIFIAAFAAALCEDRPLPEACSFAMAAAWCTHTGIAGGKKFPSQEDILSAMTL